MQSYNLHCRFYLVYMDEAEEVDHKDYHVPKILEEIQKLLKYNNKHSINNPCSVINVSTKTLYYYTILNTSTDKFRLFFKTDKAVFLGGGLFIEVRHRQVTLVGVNGEFIFSHTLSFSEVVFQ